MKKSINILSAPLLAGSAISRQIETEEQAVQAGVLRYRQLAKDAIARGDGAALKPAERMCLHWFQPLEALIKSEQEDCKAKKAGRGRNLAGPLVQQLPASQLAVIVMHEAIGQCMATTESDGVKVSMLAYSVGRAAIAQMHLAIGKESSRDSLRQLEYSCRQLSVGKVNWWANKTLDDPYTERRATAALGDVLLVCLIDSASCSDWSDKFDPAFEHVTHRGRYGYIRLTETAWKLIDDGNALRERLRPGYLPMVTEALPWQEATKDRPRCEGGYVKIRTPLVSKPRKPHKNALDAANLESVFEALNALGSSGTRINKRILAVQNQIWNEGGNELGLPRRNNEDPLVQPAAFKEWTTEQRETWKRAARAVYRRNVQTRAARKHWVSTLAVAEQFQDEEAIYFPHQLDYRGRAYPIPQPLNHQGADHHVALIQFANGIEAPLRELFIAAANTYGFDKESYDDREEWGHSHLRDIAACAADPMGTDFWRKADKPWQFLAACFAVMHPEDGAHAMVSTDGTCNGLQHYAAMMRDSDLATLVNLRNGPKPNGVYNLVAEVARKKIAFDIEDDKGATITFKSPKSATVTLRVKDIAAKAIQYAERKYVKQPTMTDLYGVTQTGARKQIQGLLKDAATPEDDRYPIARYLATIILTSIGDICPSARAAMQWFRECATVICDRGLSLSWVSPLGFPVVQPHRLLSKVMIRTLLQDLILAISDSEMPVWSKRQVDASAPNILHSVDATHMLMTAAATRRAGIDFMATHDRYFSHAANKKATAAITREQFVRVHSEPYLEVLERQWSNAHPDIIFPDRPAIGTFDINEVLTSEYFFS